MDLSNRELALIFWLIIFGVWLYKKKLHHHVSTIFKLLCRRPISTVIILAFLYVTTCILSLDYLGVWSISNLKTTILWAISSALIPMFTVNKIPEDPDYFRKYFVELFRISVVIAFIVDSFTFNFLIELILLPCVIFISLVKAVSDSKEKHKVVAKIADWILAIFGFIYFSHSISNLMKDFKDFAVIETAYEFLIPIFLSLLFLPFLYFLNIYATYERIFTTLHWAIKDKGILKFAKQRSIIAFNFNLILLAKWQRATSLFRPESKQEVLKLINETKTLRARKINPPIVDPNNGWSPYHAKDFLNEYQFKGKEYARIYDDHWQSTATYRSPKKGLYLNRIHYFVEGNEQIAQQLSIEENVTSNEIDYDLDALFWNACECLIKNAMPNDCEEIITLLDKNKDSQDFYWKEWKISFFRKDWKGRLNAYERTFTVSMLDTLSRN